MLCELCLKKAIITKIELLHNWRYLHDERYYKVKRQATDQEKIFAAFITQTIYRISQKERLGKENEQAIYNLLKKKKLKHQ